MVCVVLKFYVEWHWVALPCYLIYPFTGVCEGNQPVNCGFPSQRDSNAENVSIWWRHHVRMFWRQVGDYRQHPFTLLIINTTLQPLNYVQIIYAGWQPVGSFVVSVSSPRTGNALFIRCNKIWWLYLVPTSTTRFTGDLGYRMTKN